MADPSKLAPATTRKRALKLMQPELVASPELRKRFEREAKIGARIRSRHVVEVVAAGIETQGDLPWLVMELLDGEELATIVERRGPFAPSEAREVMAQLCQALGAAHAEGIVHRDLKPQNLFLGCRSWGESSSPSRADPGAA